MTSLKKFLNDKEYTRIKLTRTKTNHFEMDAAINGVAGKFILDTGASSTCIGLDCIEKFKLNSEASDIRAAGAGASNMPTEISKKNEITIGNWSRKRIKIVLFDLTHVNQALINHNASPVNGIIGSDILKRGKAIIDYDKKALYLRV
ncbi:retropepsin-like aspartic protease family protein [Robertkochia sediminum]|uniref:retropepsin-like aspartic protease family protein n=1 Tax=Robertkochia sediminum TaxID=2785326 RepID=UPI001931A82F|nr:retropepsin-like aspartic protease [Robertkochia sediminum]MBL7473884.1 clan AA aspartic protease [Robertkochia sediminum]